jgi:ligand-binding sensor domain-containing protein
MAGLLFRPALLSTLLLLSPVLLVAQDSVRLPGYHATWWTTAEGLPGNFVTHLAQGVDGRLWLIAGGILTRFDGEDFEIVPVGEPVDPEAPMEFPIAVAQGAGDTLYVSTYSNRLLARTHGVWVTIFETENQLDELAVHPCHACGGVRGGSGRP